MRETWYVLEDGTPGDPAEVVLDEAGVLRHKNGVAVAMRGDVHHTRGVDVDEERAKPKPKSREMKPEESKRGYKTRETKTD